MTPPITLGGCRCPCCSPPGTCCPGLSAASRLKLTLTFPAGNYPTAITGGAVALCLTVDPTNYFNFGGGLRVFGAGPYGCGCRYDWLTAFVLCADTDTGPEVRLYLCQFSRNAFGQPVVPVSGLVVGPDDLVPVTVWKCNQLSEVRESDTTLEYYDLQTELGMGRWGFQLPDLLTDPGVYLFPASPRCPLVAPAETGTLHIRAEWFPDPAGCTAPNSLDYTSADCTLSTCCAGADVEGIPVTVTILDDTGCACLDGVSYARFASRCGKSYGFLLGGFVAGATTCTDPAGTGLTFGGQMSLANAGTPNQCFWGNFGGPPRLSVGSGAEQMDLVITAIVSFTASPLEVVAAATVTAKTAGMTCAVGAIVLVVITA